MDYLFEVGRTGGGVGAGVGVLRCGSGALVRGMIVRGMAGKGVSQMNSPDIIPLTSFP